jgi:RNA-directed DNA polymerase
LAKRVILAFPALPAVSEAALVTFITEDKAFTRAWDRSLAGRPILVRRLFWVGPQMVPASGVPTTWGLPALPTAGSLAEWLGVDVPQLDWFADCRRREADVPAGPLRHYTYHWRVKSTGRARLLEQPKQKLKAIQRRILHEILDRVPPHEAVHGYRRGRSIVTAVAPHAGREIVLHFDLRDFFPSIRQSRVNALFQTLGYPRSVARILTRLCTNVVPEEVWVAAPPSMKQLLRSPHLPQGAPTSPALSNLCANSLDRRLAALATSCEANYTRYADDLTFSGGRALERAARRFQIEVCRIALEEGFEVHTHKSRFMRQGVRQQVGGIVLNTRPNVPREELDRLKAILHNCARFGPANQNRENRDDFRSYLAGRIAYVTLVNADRGCRLKSLFDRIRW